VRPGHTPQEKDDRRYSPSRAVDSSWLENSGSYVTVSFERLTPRF
jgi:hypothetical protein